jgi:hypothetical protein
MIPERFHGYSDALHSFVYTHTTYKRQLEYHFSSHFHPYVGELVKRLVEGSVSALQGADTEYVHNPDGSTQMLPSGKPRPKLYDEIFKGAHPYVATPLITEKPVKDLDFSTTGSYSVYNWELFFHVPLTVAINLSDNQHYEEAQRWFHYVFDPTDDSDGPTPERFWKVKPFQYSTVKQIQEILVNLSTGADPKLREETLAAIGAWKDAPFQPHAIARSRQTAYMFKTVMAYLDNLITWGDSLFRQETRETINEATQLYVLAANILGPRPQAVPRKGSVPPQTYASLREDLDEFGGAMRAIEAEIPFDLIPHTDAAAGPGGMEAVAAIGRSLYFCVPRNEKLLGYWDTVADRLFKIRNSLSMEGVFRQLALFEPPIDPALLAKAAAAGVDVGAVAAGANQPLPLVRFRLLAEKATELCQEVKSLGQSLLATLEKEDGEKLAILRSEQERAILKLAESVRYGQWREAEKSRMALEREFVAADERRSYYEALLGIDTGAEPLGELEGLEMADLEGLKLTSIEPRVGRRGIRFEVKSDPEAGGHKLNKHESEELEDLGKAQTRQDMAAVLEGVGAMLNLVPTFEGKVSPLGVGAGVSFGGVNLGQMMAALGAGARAFGDRYEYEAGRAGKIGAYARREDEWAFASDAASAELEHLYKQLRAAQIRELVAKREWDNHKAQIKQAEAMDAFLKDERVGKETNQAFYAYLKREVRGLYGQCFQLAFDVAKKAERALQHELGDPDLSFLQMGYMGGREGLLAGEKLLLDVKRMEIAYRDLNQREFELTKHVSLLQVDPRALLQLRSTGSCTVTLPEEVFDLDCPGHYFRRIRSVALSIPSVAGPYTSVNCTLSLLRSSIRKQPLVGDAYARAGAEDERFSDHFGSLQSIVTSSGQSDGGVFDGGDERRLPFEGSGAISQWRLELPEAVRQFDYDSMADVIMQVRYTSRGGGGLLRTAAEKNLEERIAAAEAIGSMRLFSVRHEFPTEWARFKAVKVAGEVKTAELSIELKAEHYPFWSRGRLERLVDLFLFARTAKGGAIGLAEKADGSGKADTLERDAALGLHAGKLDQIGAPESPTGKLALHFKDNSVDDLWLAVGWGKKG